MAPEGGPRWFRLNRSLHRDFGYFFAVLTALYAVSGIAVNHVDDWNPNYAISSGPVDVGPLDTDDLGVAAEQITARLRLDPAEVRGHHHAAPNQFKVFLDEGGEVSVDPANGQGTLKRVQKRAGLFQANALHLNRLKGVWTYVADAYAVVLLYLAVGGLFMLKGKTGLGGRGKWLVLAGTLLPIGFLLVP